MSFVIKGFKALCGVLPDAGIKAGKIVKKSLGLLPDLLSGKIQK